ncbi:hypothetical protein CLOM_g17374 [Closterium sp. NIES-68]|nr:hypothetical protein CLOM_g17374 [Closterium sp. NIES-68]GJP66651.1 hypothetical protein CLOP_g23563 [Closterium sp. NIES-67]
MEVGGARRLGVRRIEEGDRVVVYESRDAMRMLTVHAGQLLQNRFGVFKHSEWIGQPFGSRVRAAKGGGFVHLLAPSPALWTKVLPHRTQILYLPDMALIISRLAIAPGATVLESGTGSGSLSHSIARAVAPTGRLLSFDFHQGRAEQARAEFAANGVAHVASVAVRDIQGQGFPPALHGVAHAAFLDLPSPWLALPSAAACVVAGGRVCSFSPCMEQVQRCSDAMRREGLTDIRTVELLSRTYEVREEALIVPSLKPASDALNLEPQAEVGDGKAGVGEGCEREGCEREGAQQGGRRAGKRRRGEEGGGEEEGGRGSTAGGEDGDGEMAGTAGGGGEDGGGASAGGREGAGAAGGARREGGRRQRGAAESVGEAARYVAARPAAESKGHTGYLTFAIKPV